MGLFEIDFDDFICLRFGKTKEMTPEDKMEMISATEQFVIDSGIKEINRLRYDVSSLLDKYENNFLMNSISDKLEKFLKDLRKIERILAWDFDSVEYISKHGIEAYKRLVRKRQELVDALKYRYVQVTKEDELNA
jgi:hypothetical protein